MDRTFIAVRNMLAALDAPAYDIGVLSDRGMLPGLSNLPAHLIMSRLPLLKAHNRRGAHIYIRPSGEHRFTVLDDLNQTSIGRLTGDDFEPCAVVETSAGNFQAWLKHDDVYPTDLSTFIAQTLAGRYQGDPSAADWRRFGRLPGFTNCKPKYRKDNGLYPYVLLRSGTGNQYRMASFLRIELTKQFQLQEHERQARIAQHRATAFSPNGGMRYSHLSLERFRTAQNTSTDPPPRTSRSVWQPIRSGCPMMQWQAPSTVNTSPAIQTPQGKLPTFSALWRRRDYGRTDSRSKGAGFGRFIPARSPCRQTSSCSVRLPQIQGNRYEGVEQ